jgi:hypothetical protein
LDHRTRLRHGHLVVRPHHLSPAGVPLWSRAFTGAALNSSSEGHALGVDAAGDVAVAGVMYGSVDLGDTVRTALPQNALFVVAIPAAR